LRGFERYGLFSSVAPRLTNQRLQGWLRLSFLSVLNCHDPEVFDMRILMAATLLVCCARAGFAQDQGTENLCNPASASTVDSDGGVIIQKVVLSGKWGSNEATVYFPEEDC
jgi:hypothetical protein